MASVFFDLLATGLGLGSIYALVAIGFVLINKITGVLNFAQGHIALMGAYSIVVLSVDLRYPWYVSILIVLLFGVILALFLERAVFRYFIGEPVFSVIIITLALMGIFDGITRLVVGSTFQSYPDVFVMDWSVPLPLGASITGAFAMAVVLALTSVLLLTAFFNYTVYGQVLRAAAGDQQAAMALGISIQSTIKMAWVLSILITLIGGILFGMSQGGAGFSIADIIILILVATILGGLDSIPGAFVGSLVVGVLQTLGSFYLDPVVGPGFGGVFPITVLLVVILVRPHGLFGSEHIERL